MLLNKLKKQTAKNLFKSSSKESDSDIYKDEIEVEKILDKRTIEDITYYLVKRK